MSFFNSGEEDFIGSRRSRDASLRNRTKGGWSRNSGKNPVRIPSPLNSCFRLRNHPLGGMLQDGGRFLRSDNIVTDIQKCQKPSMTMKPTSYKARVALETKLGQGCFDKQKDVRFLSTADHAKCDLLVSTWTKTCLQRQIFQEAVVLQQIRTSKGTTNKKNVFLGVKLSINFKRGTRLVFHYFVATELCHWSHMNSDVYKTWTTPNFQKEIALVNMKIYQRSGYEKHRLVFFDQYTLITNLCS